MKRIATLLILTLTIAFNAVGQDFNIRVVNEMRMPISYAIITIEGVPRAVTDIDGAVDIDFRRIRPEYKLAAHAVGYQAFEQEVGAEAMQSGEVEYILKIDEGIVADTDVDRTSDQARAMFEECAGESTAMDFNCKMTAHFDFNYMKFHSEGTIEAENLVDSKELAYFRSEGWFHLPIQRNATEDSAQSTFHKLDESLHYALSELNFAVAAIGHNRHFYKYRPDYAFLGQSTDSQTQYYRISFPMLASKATQIIATVDVATKSVTAVSILIYDRNASILKQIEANLRAYIPSKKSKVPALCPTRLTYDYKTKYADLDLLLDQIEITPTEKKR